MIEERIQCIQNQYIVCIIIEDPKEKRSDFIKQNKGNTEAVQSNFTFICVFQINTRLHLEGREKRYKIDFSGAFFTQHA